MAVPGLVDACGAGCCCHADKESFPCAAEDPCGGLARGEMGIDAQTLGWY